MNRLLGKNKMFEDNNSPKRFQRLITLPNFSQGDLMIRENKGEGNVNSFLNREPMSIWSKNFPSASKDQGSYMQFANDCASDDTLTISENADVIFETVPDQKIQLHVAQDSPSSGKFFDKQVVATPEKELIQNTSLELSPIGESSDNIRSVEGVGKTQQPNSMTESNEVVHELLEIVNAETEIENRLDEMRRSEVDDPRNLAHKGVISSRLRAIIENWRQDETYALSSRDSWTLKRSTSDSEKASQFTNNPSLPGQPHVLRDPQNFNYLYPSEDEEVEDIRYQSQIPIRQRLRESWRTRELQKRYIRKIKDDNYISDGPDSRDDSHPHIPSFPNHLLPHPDDLVLVSRKDIDPVLEEEISS